VLSIETGSALPLCLDCVAPGGSAARQRAGIKAAEIFRSGGRLLVAGIGALAVYAYSRDGWQGVWRVAATLLQPAVILGLVPMAFLIGAIQRAAVMLVRSVLTVSGSSD
jgi:hypothetical protein